MALIALLTGVVSSAATFVATAIFWRRRAAEWELRFAADRAENARALEVERHTALQAQAEQRALFESMAEGVLLLDQSGRITMANKSFREMLRVPGEIRGKTILEAVRIPLLAEMGAKLADKDVLRTLELELPGSPPRFLEVNASTVSDQQGRGRGAIFIFHDLTRIKQLENTRREFVANVSH